MSINDSRIQSIMYWLDHKLQLDIQHFEPASSDASFRRYFRVVHGGNSQIVMDAPPEKENTEAFIRVAGLLKQSNVHVPEIFEQDLSQGFLLLEDFGSRCFLDELNNENAGDHYRHAFDSLYHLQTNTSVVKSTLPLYDAALLSKELAIFYQWFLDKTLDLSIPKQIKQTLNDFLIISALEQPHVCVHRDFHSRNLMVLTENSPGVIDFQDAVIGAISYDLVSLLRDCYISWPEEKVTEWMTVYFNRIKASGLVDTSLETFTRWFDLMGLQRHLKAIGIFSRLHLRDNKSNYLGDIPRTLKYVIHVCDKYPELLEFKQFMDHIVLPVYSKKSQ